VVGLTSLNSLAETAELTVASRVGDPAFLIGVVNIEHPMSPALLII